MCAGGWAAQRERPIAEVDLELIVDREGRFDQWARLVRTKDRIQPRLVERTAGGQRLPQIAVADELGIVGGEGASTKDVIGMDMAQQDIPYRFCSCGADCAAQQRAVGEAATGIGDEDRGVAYDEAGIGDRVLIGGGGILIQATADMDTGGDLLERGSARGMLCGEGSTGRMPGRGLDDG